VSNFQLLLNCTLINGINIRAELSANWNRGTGMI
jgi:hypothetical protein